jgi:hypothetical protein
MDSKAVCGLIFATILVATSSMLGWAHPHPPGTDDSFLDRAVAPFYSNDEHAFEAILRFGRENNIPLGVVVGDQLCSTVLSDFRTERAPARKVLDELAKNLPSYHWKLEDQVVVFTPDKLPEATLQFLAMEPHPYAIPEETLQGQTAYAWMNIRAVLKPQEGTAFNFLSSPRSEKWPALALSNMTIEQILDRLVARKTGGVWILLPFKDLSKVSDSRPFWVMGYADTGFEQLRSGCPHSEKH